MITRPITRPITSPIARRINDPFGAVLNFNALAAAMFRNGEPGVAYDFNDLSTLFQDSAGITPVTAPGQPVGLMLDKSKGLRLGPELVANGAWTAEAGAATDGTLHTLDAQYEAVRQTASLVNGRWYRLRYRVVSVTGATALTLSAGGFTASTTVVPQAIGWNEVTVLCANASLPVRFIQPNAGTAIVFGDISVRELYGNHAYVPAASPASRPTLQQTPMVGSELIANGSFGSADGWTLGAGWSVSGGTLQHSSSAFAYAEYGAANDFPTGTKYVVTLRVTTVSGSLSVYARDSTANAVITTSGTFELVLTAGAHTTGFRLGAGTWVGSVDDVSVREITGYYTDRNYLQPDGADDFFQTSSIDFTGTDEVTMFAGVRKLNDAATALVAEISSASDSTNGAFGLFAPSGAGANKLTFRIRGSSDYAASTTNAAHNAPLTAVLTGAGKIGAPICTLRLNGVQIASAGGSPGTGNFGNHPLYLFRRAGSTLPFSGPLYSLIIIGRLCTTVETGTVERLLARRTGGTLP